ncbi:MAG: hypothetical protein MJ106_06220 [Lentisphaeria bacterium]|nr:hypothetical protein [Lentisphaeria bacterium]
MQNNSAIILESAPPLPPLEELLKQSELLRGATSSATGWIYRWTAEDGRAYLVKSFARSGWISRVFFGRAGILNEWRVLNGLRENGFECAPAPVARIGSHTIVMEFIDGEELKSTKAYSKDGIAMPPQEFYEKLKEIVLALHASGICHGDFRRANVIVQKNGEPRIIDWATGMLPRGLHGILYRQFLKSDMYSLRKIVDEAYPDLLDEAERKAMEPGCILRFCRFCRQKIYRGFFKPLRKKIKSGSAD